MRVYFCLLNSIPMIHLFVSIPTSYGYYHYCSVVLLDLRNDDSPEVLSLLGNLIDEIVRYFSYPVILVCLVFFFFLYEIENCSILVCEEWSCNLDGDCIESVDDIIVNISDLKLLLVRQPFLLCYSYQYIAPTCRT